MIMADELDLQNSLSNVKQMIQVQVLEFIPSPFWFLYKNASLSLVQEPLIKLRMIKILSDEYLVAFKIKKDDVRKVPSTLAEETRQNNNNTHKFKTINLFNSKKF